MRTASAMPLHASHEKARGNASGMPYTRHAGTGVRVAPLKRPMARASAVLRTHQEQGLDMQRANKDLPPTGNFFESLPSALH